MEDLSTKIKRPEHNAAIIVILLVVIGISFMFVSRGLRTGDFNLAKVFGGTIVIPTIVTGTDQVTISWHTDDLSSSRVRYGVTASLDQTTDKFDTSPMVTEHSVTISGLISATTYYYRVVSRDSLGVMLAKSEDLTFTTASVAPVVTTTNCVTSNSATVGTDSGTTRYCHVIYDWSQVIKTADLQYATAPNGGDSSLLKLDLYLPPNDSNAPLALALNAHGGGGDKSDIGWCKALTTRGWACASINYRGAGSEANFNNVNQRMAAMDYMAAVRYLRNHASEYNLDKNRIVATGVSAGGLTADNMAQMSNDTNDSILTSDVNIVQDDGSQPSWVCYAGSHPGGTTTSNMDNFLDANDPAYIRDWHGDQDKTLDYTTTVDAFARLSTTISAELTTIVGAGHKLESGDTIIPQLFADLYSKVILGSCPPSYSSILPIQ